MKTVDFAARGGRLVLILSGIVTTTMADTLSVDSSGVFHLGDVTVLGRRKDLDRVSPSAPSQADPRRDVAHQLARLPGVALQTMGGRAETQVSVRGFDSRQVAVFLDGVPIYVPYDGNLDLGRFATSDLASLSVEKGFSSMAYGPNAMGGAVNLVSRKPTSPLEIRASAGLRGWAGQEAELRLGTRLGDWYAQGTASGLWKQSSELSEDFVPTKSEDGGRRENSRTIDRTLEGKVGYNPAPGKEISFTLVSQHGEKGNPVYAGKDTASSMTKYWSWPYWDKTSAYGLARWTLGEHCWVRVPVYVDHFENSLWAYDNTSRTTLKKKSSWTSAYDDLGWGGSTEFGGGWNGDTAKVFFHLKRDEHLEHNTTNDTAKAAGTQAFVTKPDLTFQDMTLSAGLEGRKELGWGLSFLPGISWSRRTADRADNLLEPKSYQYSVESFALSDADAFDGQAALRWAQDAASEWKLSVSSRTRFPTIKERYSYRLGTAIPNPDLQPERSTQVELTWLTRPTEWSVLQASLWEAWVSDAIQTVTKVGPKGESQSQNVGFARYGGGEIWGNDANAALPAPELSAQVRLPSPLFLVNRLSLSSTYSYVKRRNIDDPSFRFTNLPQHRWTGSVVWAPVSWLDLHWTTEAASSAFSHTADDKLRVKPYSVSHAGASVTAYGATVEAGLQNVFDKDYAYMEGYPEEGRTGYARISFDFRH